MTGPEVIYNVSRSQLSLARHYGSIRFNGALYYYCPVTDTLTRADVLAARKEWRVIVNDGDDAPDRFLGKPYKSRARALKALQAQPAGTLGCLFGPEGAETWIYSGARASQ